MGLGTRVFLVLPAPPGRRVGGPAGKEGVDQSADKADAESSSPAQQTDSGMVAQGVLQKRGSPGISQKTLSHPLGVENGTPRTAVTVQAPTWHRPRPHTQAPRE